MKKIVLLFLFSTLNLCLSQSRFDKSYGKKGERYEDLQIPKYNIIAIDSNQIYNLYFNYTKYCPIVLLKNDRNIGIFARVKKTTDGLF